MVEPSLARLSPGKALQVLRGEDAPRGMEQVQSIVRKGFHSEDITSIKQLFRKVCNEEVPSLDSEGCFSRPSPALYEGLLGAEGSQRLATLESFMGLQEVMQAKPKEGTLALTNDPLQGPGSSSRDALKRVAAELEERSNQVATWAPSLLNFQVDTRTPFMLLEAGSSANRDGKHEPMNNDALLRWIHIFQRHRIMIVLCLGPEPGSLEMRPMTEDAGTHRIQLRPGSLVMLRVDCLTHRFAARGKCYLMVTFLLGAHPQQNAPLAIELQNELSHNLMKLKEDSRNEDDFEMKASRQMQRLANQSLHKGQQAAIRGCAAREPLCTHDPDAFCAAVFAGCDGGQMIPHMRWDHDYYYSPDPSLEGSSWKTYTTHGAFVEGIDLFDNKMFKISPMEAAGMDPLQRHSLEIFLECMLSAGINEAKMMRSNVGVFLGGPNSTGSEWATMPKDDIAGALGGTSQSSAIMSNRLSFVFGIHGPNFFMDMEGSASLIAFNLAVDSIQREKPQCTAAVAMGMDCNIHPSGLLQISWAGLTSKKGRCLSFDNFADGFIRGDGFAACYINPLLHEVDGKTVLDEDPPIIALCSGTFINNNGRSATLSAPSGAMLQELVANSVRSAQISPLDVDAVECHAAGGILSDAVEATAMCRAYRLFSDTMNDEEEVLGLTAGKSSYGNERPAAGISAVLRCMVGLAMGSIVPTLHLRKLNPHVVMGEDSPTLFATEHVQYRMASAFQAITCMGIGGSNAHTIMWGRAYGRQTKVEKQVQAEEVLAFWPGGGGELHPECEPRTGCSIMGSWSQLDRPEPMRSEGLDQFSYVVTLGEHSVEWFQIWLDGEKDRILHPGTERGLVEGKVYGPHSYRDASGFGWAIDTRVRYAASGRGLTFDNHPDPSLPNLPGPDAGNPGDQFRVRLQVKGRFRAVTWERLDSRMVQRNGFPKTMGKYYVVGSWNDWTPEEMTLEDEYLGRYSVKAVLPKGKCRFQILRNKDWKQLIYPETCYADHEDGIPVKGPDASGHDSYWNIEANPSKNVVCIDLELWPEDKESYSGDSRSSSCRPVKDMKVSWRNVGHHPLSDEDQFEKNRPSFFLVGNWDGWQKRTKMRFDGLRQSYVARVPERARGGELFQVLSGGDWNSVLHPSLHEAGMEYSQAIRGAGVRGYPAWLLDKAVQDGDDKGNKRHEVLLSIKSKPWTVQWHHCPDEDADSGSDSDLDPLLYGSDGL